MALISFCFGVVYGKHRNGRALNFKMKSEPPSFVALIILVFTVLASMTGGYVFFCKCLPFNSDRSFDGAKAFFQTSDEQSKSTWQKNQDFDDLANYQILIDAADYFDASETNEVARAKLRRMIQCYEKYQVIIPKVYSDLEDYNQKIAIAATVALVLSVLIAWASWRSGYESCSRQSADGGGLNKSTAGVKSSVDKITRRKKRPDQ